MRLNEGKLAGQRIETGLGLIVLVFPLSTVHSSKFNVIWLDKGTKAQHSREHTVPILSGGVIKNVQFFLIIMQPAVAIANT
jgi:hypothetical protein